MVSSEKPIRLVSQSSSAPRVSDSSRLSMVATLAKARVNQGSMPVMRDSSSGLAPRLRAAMRAHVRWSLGCRGSPSRRVSRSPFHWGSSHNRERSVISRERTAFWKAASKERSMAMTSPVAFIWVPMVRSP